MNLLTSPLFSLLLFFYKMTGNFGFSIILFTLAIRAALIPLSTPAMKSQKKIQAIKPQLDALKKKYGTDKAKIQQEQLRIYQENKINPLGGCLPYLLQFVVLIALYSVLNTILTSGQIAGISINTSFFGWDLAKPDTTFILPVLAGVTQLLLSVMLLPGAEKHDLIPNNPKTKKMKEENKKEGDTLEMAETMQKQMVFMMPVVTGFMAARFPAGLALYWVITTVFNLVQQYFVSGAGGLSQYWLKIQQIITKQKTTKVVKK